MTTVKRALPVLVFVAAMATLSGSAFSADETAQQYDQYRQTMQSLSRELHEKQDALRNLSAEGQRDDAKARQLFEEIADIRARMFAARTALQAAADGAAPTYGIDARDGYGCGGYGNGGCWSGGGMMGQGGPRRGGYRGHGCGW